MKIQIPQHWKDRIASDPDGEFARRTLSTRQRVAAVNNVESKIEKIAVRSNVGTILARLFKDRIGAVPCGNCKAVIGSLNSMTVEHIRNHAEEIIGRIEHNSKNAKSAWWAKLLAHADAVVTGGVVSRHLIAKWLAEACDEDEREAAGIVSGSDRSTDAVDHLAQG